MNTREKVTIRSPNEINEECVKFTIDDTSKPFVFRRIAKTGKEYTFSSYLMSEEDAVINVGGEEIPITVNWDRQCASFIAETSNVKIYFKTPGIYYFFETQLEEGNTMTGWTQAPEDVATVTLMKSAIEASAKEIELSVSAVRKKVESTEASLKLKVDLDTLISEINATADIINLRGGHFIVESDNLTIDKDGKIKAVNGEFTGVIKVKSGEIGGFAIDDDGLVYGNEDSGVFTKISGKEIRWIAGIEEEIYNEIAGRNEMYYENRWFQFYYAYKEADADAFTLTPVGGMDARGIFTGESYQDFVNNPAEYLITWDGEMRPQNIIADKTIYAGSDMRFDNANSGETRGISTYWSDNELHYIVDRSSDGLTASFGWAGTSEKATVTKIRGRTCQVQNSSGTTALSDERLKKDFTKMDKWDAFYDLLEPYAFKMKTGDSGRFHMGFKAQQVEQALLSSGLTTQDFAGFVKMKYIPDEDDLEGRAVYKEAGIESGEDEFGLIYTEFVPINTYQIQKVKTELGLMRKEIKELRSMILQEEIDE